MAGPTVEFDCPYCGYPNFSPIDPISGHQQWTTDCENCCRPIALSARVVRGEVEEFDVEREQD
ncbi:MAG TPA: CPXCG motif-containing cysteine-rich protein [bacterium]|nr:CPXCG motif-containing cysteine-rich protein [bacterium]